MSVRRRVASVAAVVLGALCAGPAAAGAHPLLLTAAPAPGALIPGAPSAVTLAFSEPAVAAGSAVAVAAIHGAQAHPIKLGPVHGAAAGRQLTVRLPKHLGPGVYRVRWVALGVDGHTVSGSFDWGIAEPDGSPPPGAAAGRGVAGSGGRGGSAGGPGVVSTAVQWLGLLAASLLWAGALLPFARARPGRWRRWALFAALGASVYGVLQQAGAGAGGGLDFGLLTASGTGIAALARLAIVLALFRAPGIAGLGLLAGYGLSGHALAQGSATAAFLVAAHVVAAGTWAGGVLLLLALAWRGAIPLREGATEFAPYAAAGLAVAAVTGVITGVREVSHWYFLWWSAYGRLVLVKAALVTVAAGLGLLTARHARGRVALTAEGGLVLVVLALAGTLSGLAQGRGEPLPAQRGDLLPGPALSTVLLPGGPAPVTLAPARPGINTITVAPRGPGVHTVLARLVCGCDRRPVIAALHRAGGAVYVAQLPVPSAGTWNAYVSVDGRQAATPAALPVGLPHAAGAPVRDVLAIGDLSGPGADRCTKYLIGVELAIARLNGAGGVDGGEKVALDALDDGGSAATAGSEARSALAAGRNAPIALLPCGAGAEPAMTASSRAGVPTVAGDPATGLVAARRIYRVASDPYADGVALAQAIETEVKPQLIRGERTLKVVAVGDAQGRRRLAGLRAELQAGMPSLRVKLIPLSELTAAGGGRLAALLSRRRTAALIVDGTDAQSPSIGAAIGRLPAEARVFDPAPVFVSERVLSEPFIERSGNAAKIGVVQGTSAVAVDSRDGLVLSQALPTLFPGASASLESLRGYIAGLALAYGVADGTDPAAIAARLHRPAPFTDAIATPWLSGAPSAGDPRLTVLEPSFLSSTLLPQSSGGEAFSGLYFPGGAWERPVTTLLGPPLAGAATPTGVRGSPRTG